MSGTIELDGFEEFQEFIEDMSLDISTKRQAVRVGINEIGKGLENDTPVGLTGELAEIKTSVKENALATEGTAKSNAFYDVFQNFGTSEQKAHVGYFDRSVESNTEEAISKVAETIFKKMR
ncbi:HK97-gp10 family putative phage morphogenesis protein [Paraclostridium bifermentans]|uniref:HK97-gp10 family putative phage morphogenesis protein n=1 Tax=Paraclostridium bifermentans TaxID=1490 RepID=UPI0018A9FF82|nr:HK97-gp10 family putative phage morphogenesis protein [Paraclostridium bifermentans]